MAPFVSIGPPVSVSASPIDKKSASPSMKGGNNGQGDLASSNDSTPPHSQMPASLSFSPSHYPISELPSVLDEDIIVSPQPKPRENPSIGLSVCVKTMTDVQIVLIEMRCGRNTHRCLRTPHLIPSNLRHRYHSLLLSMTTIFICPRKAYHLRFP
ncbi:hypothetical protein BDY19DRAFT_82421 [Irpex rosettiformis]|uniref:Uncharacterized protein n=1 Tax=Irpex rosettiformis TaxID=378272 RepID=A0ACB8U5W9_9APHY|nr:hypothetical protein BDY19DRAFT_82421 [Irpex rosettiformis]